MKKPLMNYFELFIIMDQDKDGVLNYQEFKSGFKKLMEITRIRNVMKEIKTIKEEPKPVVEEEKKEKEKNEGNNEENNNEENKEENKESGNKKEE